MHSNGTHRLQTLAQIYCKFLGVTKYFVLLINIWRFVFFFFASRHSDDPLISGALDDNQNEFDTITGCGNSLVPMETSTSTFNKKSTRVRKSGNLKLRFHHQALPQEYLDHYEATQNHFNSKEMTLGTLPSNVRSSKKDRMATSTIQSYSPSNDSVVAADASGEKSVQMWLQKSAKHQNGRENDQSKGTVAKHSPKMTTQDLPFMGEITLDNFKPRRGRKPKKADICHLIYKNYGTIFPNQKSDETELDLDAPNNNTEATINQSLLERRLTDSGDGADAPPLTQDGDDNAEEPLNLCVRDRYDSDVMTVVSDEEGSDSEKFTDSKADLPLLTNETLSAAHFPPNLKMALPNFQSALLDNKHELSETAGIDMDTDLSQYNCWQNSGMFLNPMVLYLQKIANSNSNASATNYGQRTSESPKSESIESNANDTNAIRNRPRRMLIPKKMSQLMKDDLSNSETSHTVTPTTVSTSISNKVTLSASQTNQKNPNAPKRKRSAIFIPPVPEESSTNHATEVSICKFKFTGGAKPSLQEKKMLSVDAGGNFRYYSGTGDKSIRGYEFFPRESLKQSSLVSASSAGAFLNTPGQKITNDIPPPSFGLSNELLQIPEINTPLSTENATANSIHTHPHQLQQHSKQQHYHNTRKRKSKRSMQREKLEKTFKEKGFLIQTQQLEQAEGTYCKFRQLRKFTRYLFRSWKDYLPGELQQNQTNPAAAAEALQQASTSSINDHNGIDTSSSPHFMPPSPTSSHED